MTDYEIKLQRVRIAMPNAQLISDVAELFKICGDPTRVGIICAIVGAEFRVSDIADILGMSSSAISHQLRMLKHMSIVSSRREGKSVFYAISDKHIGEILNMAFSHVMEDNAYETAG